MVVNSNRLQIPVKPSSADLPADINYPKPNICVASAMRL